jgi:hypothetical protein
MATIGGTALTLVDFARRLDPSTNSVSVNIAELLNQSNEVLTDMLWKEGNLPTGHRLTMRTSLPTSTWRKLNEGIDPTKSTTVQVDESCAMLEQKGQIDKDLALLNGNSTAFRLSENVAHMEALNQDMATALFYADVASAPEKFNGLSTRYASLSAGNAQNIIDAGGTGSDNTSIWLAGWGPNSGYGIFPKGSQAGLQHTMVQDGTGDGCAEVLDSNSKTYRAFVDRYQWKCGLAIADWRYFVRICNIDVSNLVGESSAADIIKLMSRQIDRLPTRNGIKPVFYMNRTVFSMLRIQALNKSNYALSVNDALTQFGSETVKGKQLEFQGIPIRKVDAILGTEARIT